jgi:hypothetical protein
METSNLKINDKVAYNTSNNRIGKDTIGFGLVAKITKTGVVTLDTGRKFNRGGVELKGEINDYPSARLITLDHANRIMVVEDEKIEIAVLKGRLEDKLNKHSLLTSTQKDLMTKLIEAFPIN